MSTKFIGRDGYAEIENLSETKKSTSKKSNIGNAKKTVRFVKRAVTLCVKKTKLKFKRKSRKVKDVRILKATAKTVPELISIENRSEAAEFNSSAKEALTSIVSVNNRRYAHSAPKTGSLKRKAFLAIVACLTASSLSFATVASALDMPHSVKKNTAENVLVETQPYIETVTDAESAVDTDSFEHVEYTGLYIDGELMGVVEDGKALSEALDKLLLDYRDGYDDETTTEFANSVEVKTDRFDDAKLVSVDELLSKCDGKFSYSLETDYINTYDIDYDTEYEYNDNEKVSYEEVKTEGKNGKLKETVRVTFIDGVQTDAVVTESEVVEKPVTEVVVKGTIEQGAATGSFIWPLPYTHTITSYFEWRWGRMHNGVDISDSGVYGQPAVAADGGVVTHAGDLGDGYGNYVIVDHGNGYSTLYGHFSSVAVSTGDYVSQGDVVGYVGSTGNSTGPHLHFEIMVNGEKTNPLEYVS